MPEQAMVPLPGSERREQPGATRVGSVPDDETIQFSVVVRSRKGAPDMEEVARNASITGKFLSREELAEATAPDPADVQAVEEYAHRNGLTVEGADPFTRRVRLAGSAAAVKQAFGVSLDRYEYGGKTFRGRTGPVLVPESLADIIVGVLGTDDRPMAHRLTTLAHQSPQFASGSSVPMTAVQMASYYNYPAGLDGTGQCIGIIEFGGGYFLQDINAYFSALGIKTPSIVDVPVDGGSNSPTPGTGLTNDTPSLETAEVELDIEVAGSAAPGASLAVYFVGSNTTNSWLDAVNAAIGDSANNPSVLSISWGAAEDSVPGQLIAPVNLALASAGAVGITVLIASGDQGSQGSWGGQVPPMRWPRQLRSLVTERHRRRRHRAAAERQRRGAAEVVWNKGATTSASGGGVSNYFDTVPSYQSSAGINPVSANPPGNTGRGVPDVSANADSYQVCIRGQNVTVGGTSAATPLWAALFADSTEGIGGRAGLPLATLYGPLLDRRGAERHHDRRQRSLHSGTAGMPAPASAHRTAPRS